MFIKGILGGIYKIICSSTGKIYVGSSINISKRLGEHKTLLRGNKHRNPHMQKAWNKYGEKNFKFEIIEKINNNSTIEKENFWIEKFNTRNNKYGFNIVKPGDPPFLGRSHTKESKIKIGNQIWTDERRKKIGAAHRGSKHTQETKFKMSISSKGKKKSKIARENMSKSHKGLHVGQKNNNVKLVDSDIPEIREMRKRGMTIKEIAIIYCIGRGAIDGVIYGKNWKHVK